MSSGPSSRDTTQEESAAEANDVVHVPNASLIPPHPWRIDNMDAEEPSNEDPEINYEPPAMDEEIVIQDDHVMPQLIEDVPLPDAPQFQIPLHNGFGEVSDDEDESDEDADPNENVQNGYGLGVDNVDDEWDAQSAGTERLSSELTRSTN